MKVLPQIGVAFVCFKNRDHAAAAKASNPAGSSLRGTNILISQCLIKEERQRQLEVEKDKKAYLLKKRQKVIGN